MEIIYLKEDMQLHMTDSIVAAIGFFDGLHVGHMALVEEVKRVADTKHYHKALITLCIRKVKRRKMSDFH